MVKRRIARFSLKSRRGPHTHKTLHREIDRRVDYGRSHSSLIRRSHSSLTFVVTFVVTFVAHICRSHSSLTFVALIRRSHSSLTFVAHIRRSHSSLTFVAHIRRSHSSLTFVMLICDDPSQSRTRDPPKKKSKFWRMSWHVFRPHFIRAFLLSCITGPPRGVDPYLVNQICDDYDKARHHFEDFNEGMEDVFQSRIEVLR